MFLTFPGLSLQLSICCLSDSGVFVMKINRNNMPALWAALQCPCAVTSWSSECLDNVPCKVPQFLVK